jgi:hypothetical protein
VGLMLFSAGGHFVAQVPDLYVVGRYARATAEGHPFQYNAGEAPTTGSTSLLYTGVLAFAHASGARASSRSRCSSASGSISGRYSAFQYWFYQTR